MINPNYLPMQGSMRYEKVKVLFPCHFTKPLLYLKPFKKSIVKENVRYLMTSFV